MKNWMKVIGLLAVFGVGVTSALAQEDSHTVAKSKIETMLRMTVSSVANSPVDGILQVMTERGIFYVSEDAKYLLHGRIYNMDEEMRNETEEALVDVRRDGVKTFEKDVIEFKAKNEKHSVTIFTDITCGYCRKLHNEIDQYNDQGITVRYLAFPPAGLGSKGFDDLVSIWCADDKQEAMTSAKAGNAVVAKTCETKVAEQYQFGQQIGVSGTPAIIFDDGTMEPGYRPAAQLAQILNAAKG
jgi:thiol:disulfide interchange protein DsbC